MTILIIGANDESLQFEEAMNAAGVACQWAADAPAPAGVEIVVDFTPEPAAEKAERLQQFTGSGAVALCSTLCCTATDVMGRLDNQLPVAGVNGLPLLWLSGKTVEIAPALQCPPDATAKITNMLQSIGFTTELTEDRIALVAPRILATLINEAAFAVMENVASAGDIDAAMRLGVNYPKGLLAWADELGIDRVVQILDALYGEYHQERYRACVLLRQLVRAGYAGQKTGRGFYRYAG